MLLLKKNSDQGFSLIECLIALVILGILMTGGMAFYYQANTLYYHGLHYQMATWLADSRMEQIKNAGCTQSPTALANTCWNQDISSTGTATANLTSTTFNTTCPTACTATTVPCYIRKVTMPGCTAINVVTVQISWKEPGESANSNIHHVTIATNVGQ